MKNSSEDRFADKSQSKDGNSTEINLPCFRGKMGSTIFYQAIIPICDLVELVRPPNEENLWAYKGIEERRNNDPSTQRIQDELIPYLENSQNRFFGSLVVLIDGGEVKFDSETLWSRSGSPNRVGFLTLKNSELVVLDGLHRLIALIDAVDRSKTKLNDSHIKNDDISVVFIRHETDKKTGEIFNKLKRHARPASRSDRLIVDEDDTYAVIARRLLSKGEPLGAQDEKGELLLVNWKNHTLSARTRQFTTLSTVYETVKLILTYHGKPKDWETQTNVEPREKEEAYEIVKQVWQTVVDHLEPLKQAHEIPSPVPEMRLPDKKYSLLLKPVGQIALFEGIAIAKQHNLSILTAVQRANDIDWSMIADEWQGNLVRSSGIVETRTDRLRNAAYLVAYRIAADKMSKGEREKIYNLYNSDRRDNPIPLPETSFPLDS